jgi:hypothetical protein
MPQVEVCGDKGSLHEKWYVLGHFIFKSVLEKPTIIAVY